MYRACSLLKSQRVSTLLRQSTLSSMVNNNGQQQQQRGYSSSKKTSKFSLDFEDDEDLVIDTRIQEKKLEIKKEEEIDIDDMIANTTLKELKLMRWTENYEALELAKRENVDLHDIFTPDETTEEVQAKIAAQENAELKGSKFQSVKLTYKQLSQIKTAYISKLLNQFKDTFEKPLVQLYKETISEANNIYFSARADKKRLLKEKLRNSVRRKLSGLETHFQDLIFVRNALQHAVEEPSRLDPEVVDEAWQRLLNRSDIMDPDNLARDLMSDEYNDFGQEYEYAENYITQLSMIPYDFRNPKSFNSLVELYDKFIEEIDGGNGNVGVSSELTVEQVEFERSIDQLRQLAVESSPAQLESFLAVKLAGGNLIEIPQSIKQDFTASRVIPSLTETLKQRFLEEVESMGGENGEAEDEDFAEDRPQIENPDSELAPAKPESLTASQRTNRRLQEKYELLLADIQDKTMRAEDTPAKSIGAAVDANEMLALSKKQLTGIQYDEQKFMDIAHPEDKVVEEGAEEKQEETPAAADAAAVEESAPVLTKKQLAQQNLDRLVKNRDELLAKGIPLVDIEFAIEQAKYDLESNEVDDELVDMDDDEDELKMDDDHDDDEQDAEEVEEEEDLEDDEDFEGDEEDEPLNEQLDQLPDFKTLSSKLMESEISDLSRIAKKFYGQPMNEKTASDVLEELFQSHMKTREFDKDLVKHDYDVLREAHGDVHMPSSVQFQYDTGFRDLVDRDVIFKMPLKDTDLVRVLTHQLSEFGLVNQNKVLKDAPDNIPVPRSIVEAESNDGLFPDILDHIDEAREIGLGSKARQQQQKSNNNENNNNNNTTSSSSSTSSTSSGSTLSSSPSTKNNNNNNNNVQSNSNINNFNNTDAIYDSKRLYTELVPIFDDSGVVTLPPKSDLRKKVAPDGKDSIKGASGISKKDFHSNDLWLMGKPFDISKYRLGGQENPLPYYRFGQPLEFTEDDEDPAPPPDASLFDDIETYRYFQEGRGEEWFGPEKVGDKHIDPLNQTMRWYPREHLPTYPFQFEISHNTQDQYAEDFWSNRKVVMRVNIAALNLPEVVEQRLIELTYNRFDTEKRVLTLVANNHKSQDENKHQCKSLFKNLLHEAYLADPNFVSVRTDNYKPDSNVSTFVPSKSAKKLEKFNLLRLTGWNTAQEQKIKQDALDKLKSLL
ncbi:hypothetical protein PPL_05303 [Heterostelium album PN500]|uniref:Small ribosomal subunit protein mS35 mitochondrial conserved domain-containing protein n=1 Tax=Heterostelium pallidum (strain ATCC 26659 / Pp 5 / PN500) TaxID=670386 RepID=D3BBB6_HETP5|nr:hypothetical protein PPL_05303 [Heterostelium album PN500]EFA81323.1 hypothetical protein PPL_05303 [Heterostelium album PN500]|eukprot:XP_020433441.1 hypothetical protein PPL_05303 [Heterostelium album PN500]